MTTVTSPKTGPIVNGLKRALHLRRTRGNARALYALAWKLASKSPLKWFVKLAAVDLLHISLANQKTMPPTPRSLVVRLAQAEDLPALAEYYGMDQLVTDRFERGDLCVTTWCQDRIGAALWIAVGPNEFREDYRDLRCAFRFPAGVGWTYDGKGTRWGAWGTLMAQLPHLLSEREVGELFTVIDCNNWQSIDSHRSLGYDNVGILAFARVFGFAQSLCRPSERWWRRLPVRVGKLVLQREPNATRGEPDAPMGEPDA